MAQLNNIEGFLNDTLQCATIRDYAPNGVQVRGKGEVGHVVSGVSASLELFDAAIADGADAVLVHHGLFWEKASRVVEGSMKQRLKRLLDHDLTLLAYHLPLDRHPELGNNIRILRGLGLERGGPFGLYHGQHLSFMGESPVPLALEEVVQRCRALFGGDPVALLPHGPVMIRRIAICSGGAPELVQEAKAAGADLFLSGEASEPMYHFAKEEGMHVVAVGHHRSERLGVQAVGALLTERFGLTHRFIDSANPL